MENIEIMAALNKALFAEAAVKSLSAQLNHEEKVLAACVADLEAKMLAANITTLGSAIGSADITPKLVYNVLDWQPLHARIMRTGEFDMLYRRVNQKAMADRAGNNDLPEGVRAVELKVLKLTLV